MVEAAGENSSSVEWAVRMLALTDSTDEIRHVLRSSARAAVHAQGATVVEFEGDHCYYADEDAMSPLWKGQRFPVGVCISGWAVIHRQTVVVPDIHVDDRIPQEAYRPTFVRSLVMVPLTVGQPVGAVGVYWSYLHAATDAEVQALEWLVGAAAQALERVRGPMAARSAPFLQRGALLAASQEPRSSGDGNERVRPTPVPAG